MSNFKKAAKLDLTFQTEKGVVNVHSLFKASVVTLAAMLKKQYEIVKQTGSPDELSFLDANSKKVDEIEQLRFDILKEIYLDKQQEIAEKAASVEREEQKVKLLKLISEKKDESLKSKSVEELQKELDALLGK